MRAGVEIPNCLRQIYRVLLLTLLSGFEYVFLWPTTYMHTQSYIWKGLEKISLLLRREWDSRLWMEEILVPIHFWDVPALGRAASSPSSSWQNGKLLQGLRRWKTLWKSVFDIRGIVRDKLLLLIPAHRSKVPSILQSFSNLNQHQQWNCPVYQWNTANSIKAY